MQVSFDVAEQARAGEVFTVEVHVRDGAGQIVRGPAVELGDGTSTLAGSDIADSRRPRAGDAVVDCLAGRSYEPPTTDEVEQVTHAYRAAGTYEVTARVTTTGGPTCGGADIVRETAEASTEITVMGSTSVANGPRGPRLDIGHQRYTPFDDGEEGTLSIDVGAGDADGYVSRLALDWGDGSEASVVTRPLGDCEDSATRWPRSSLVETFTHRYDAAGSYTVTAEVVSVGCDGSAEQRRTATRTVLHSRDG